MIYEFRFMIVNPPYKNPFCVNVFFIHSLIENFNNV